MATTTIPEKWQKLTFDVKTWKTRKPNDDTIEKLHALGYDFISDRDYNYYNTKIDKSLPVRFMAVLNIHRAVDIQAQDHFNHYFRTHIFAENFPVPIKDVLHAIRNNPRLTFVSAPMRNEDCGAHKAMFRTRNCDLEDIQAWNFEFNPRAA